MMRSRTSIVMFALVALFGPGPKAATDVHPSAGGPARHLLYVAVPGVRNYVEHGGVGILVFDIDNGHRFLKRIPTFETRDGEAPEAIKGIAASAKTGILYITTIKRLVTICLDSKWAIFRAERSSTGSRSRATRKVR